MGKTTRRRRVYFLPVMAATLVFWGAALGFPSWAETMIEPGVKESDVPEEYDAQTWEKLKDNVLEYEELEDRIKNFNPSMVSADCLFQSAMSDVKDEAEAAYKQYHDYKDDADDIRDSGELTTQQGQTMYAALRDYQESMKSTGDKLSIAYNVNIRTTSSSYNSIRKAQKQLTSASQQVMIGYNTALTQRDTLVTMKEMYEKMYNAKVAMKSLGMATEVDVTEASKNLLMAENSLASLDNTIESLRSTLCLLTGWTREEVVQIQPVPSVDLNKITQMDLEKDTETAICNNYDLIEERHQESDRSTAGINAKKRNVEQDEQNLTIKMELLYQDVVEKKKTYEAALTAYDQAIVKQEAANVQLQNGSISQIEYLSQMLLYYQAMGEKTSSDMALQQAIELYDWAIDGIVDL